VDEPLLFPVLFLKRSERLLRSHIVVWVDGSVPWFGVSVAWR
jgi:hypothetical protein